MVQDYQNTTLKSTQENTHLLCTDTFCQRQLARKDLAECSRHPACPPCPPRSDQTPLGEGKQQREAGSPALVLGPVLVAPQPAPGSKGTEELADI